MSDTRYLDRPFFDDKHRQLARDVDAWATRHVPHHHRTTAVLQIWGGLGLVSEQPGHWPGAVCKVGA